MTAIIPTPDRCLALLLGASSWPKHSEFLDSPIFKRSAETIRDYLLGQEGFGIPASNLLDLFDSPEFSGQIVANINEFLYSRITDMRSQGRPASDIIVYYVGHGGFANQTSEYFLALKSTQMPDLYLTSLPILSLARTMNEQARHLRRYIVLDSCFSAAAYRAFQSGPLDVAIAKIEDSFPSEGTALLCSSGPRDPSKAPEKNRYTMFTGALIDILTKGDPLAPPVMSLQDLGHIIRQRLKESYQDDAVRPEVHAPAQKHGNVDEVPLFRNHFNQDKKGRTSKSTARANPTAAVNLRPPLLGPIIGHTTDTTCRIWMQAAEPGDRGAIYSRERMTIGLVAVVAKDGERIRKPRLYLFRLHRHNNRIGLLDIGRDGGLDVDQGNRLLAPNTDYTIRTAVLVVDEFSARTDLITDAEVVSRLPASRFLLEELSRLPSRDSEASLHTFPAEGTIAKQISFVLSTCSYRDMSKQPSRRCQY